MSGSDPVRRCFIDAMMRRAAKHQVPIRRLLDERLAQLAATLGDYDGPTTIAAPSAPAQARRSPLAELLADLAQRNAHAISPAQQQAQPLHGAAELKTVSRSRGTWSRLHVERRLSQAQSQVPAHAGPLNTQWLLHQALAVMRDTSPAYAHHFVAQVEALLQLEPAQPLAGTGASIASKQPAKQPGKQSGKQSDKPSRGVARDRKSGSSRSV